MKTTIQNKAQCGKASAPDNPLSPTVTAIHATSTLLTTITNV